MVGFSQLVTRLKPQNVIRIVDYLHALVDEAYSSEEIFIMERSSDSCTAVAGLCETVLEEDSLTDDSLSLADSSYGSQSHLLDYEQNNRRQKRNEVSCQDVSTKSLKTLKTASHFAGILASAVLNLMSTSSKINVPLDGRKQLQLRISMHSGPCLAGVQGLQTSMGSNRIPQFKIMGPAVTHASSLCLTGLALQIRVSKDCKELIARDGDFLFERCPDMSWANRKPIESYWLVGKKDLPLNLPSLDLAVPLSEYEDTNI